MASRIDDDAAGPEAAASRETMIWWRWGRVELPVQNLQPETTTSVSDALSSNARADIGTVTDAPVTSPCGLCSGLRDAHPERIPAA